MTNKLNTLAAILFTALLGGVANGAILFTVNTSSGHVTTSGSYSLLDATAVSNAVSRILPTSNGTWTFFTDGAGSTQLLPHVPVPRDTVLEFTSLLSFRITDTSNNAADLATGTIPSWIFPDNPNSILNLNNSTITFGAFDDKVDAGDLLIFEGSTFLTPDSLAVVASFSPSAHISTYNGNTFTLAFVPEPSTTLLAGLSLLGTLFRRQRNYIGRTSA